MNEKLAHYVATIFTGWYSSVARWVPPGSASASTCTTCSNSVFMELPVLADWPHDVVHTLVDSLTVAVSEVQLSLEELDEDIRRRESGTTESDRIGRRMVYARHATHLVFAAAALHSDDVLDVLENCVGPAIEEYVAREISSAMHDLEHAGEPRE